MFLTVASCTGQKVIEKKQSQNTEEKSTPLVHKNDQKSTKADMENMIYLNEGENKFFEAYEMNVTFQKMEGDSRCPQDIQCVWAGVGTVSVQFMGTYTRPVNVKLSTIDDVKKGLSKSAIFNGYKISLLKLDPYPKSSADKKNNIGKHKIAFQIIKLAENQIEPSVR